MEWQDRLPGSHPSISPEAQAAAAALRDAELPLTWTAVSACNGENTGAWAPSSNINNSIRAKSVQSENASITLKNCHLD